MAHRLPFAVAVLVSRRADASDDPEEVLAGLGGARFGATAGFGQREPFPNAATHPIRGETRGEGDGGATLGGGFRVGVRARVIVGIDVRGVVVVVVGAGAVMPFAAASAAASSAQPQP